MTVAPPSPPKEPEVSETEIEKACADFNVDAVIVSKTECEEKMD